MSWLLLVLRLVLPQREEHITVMGRGGDIGFAPSAFDVQDLAAFGPSSASRIGGARTLAGVPFERDRVTINGLPMRVRLASAAFGRMSVQADPYSVQWSDAGANQIDLTIVAPPTRWTWQAAGVVPHPRRSSPAAYGSTVISSWRPSAGISGPIGDSALSVQLAAEGASVRVSRRPPAPGAFALPEGDEAFDPGETVDLDRSLSIFGALHIGRSASRRLAVWVNHERNRSEGVVAGVPWSDRRVEARSRVTAGQIAIDVAHPTVSERHRIGVVFDTQSSTGTALQPQVDVIDVLSIGGPADLPAFTVRRAWSGTHTVESNDTGAPWLAGVAWSRASSVDWWTPSRDGRLVFGTLSAFHEEAAGGAPLRLRTTGSPRQQATVADVAAFAERRLRWRAVTATAGLRLSGGTFAPLRASLRTTATLSRGPWVIRAGIGQFVQPVDAADIASASPVAGAAHWINDRSVTSILRPDFRRAERLMARIGVARRWLSARISIEESWLASRQEPLTIRVVSIGGYEDALGADRSLRRRQTEIAAGASVGRVQLSASARWVESRDDADPLGREWARTAGVPRWAAALNAEAVGPVGLRFTLAWSQRGRAAADVKTGLDPSGIGLFLDRGPRARNSDTEPGFSSADFGVMRRIRIAAVAFNVGFRADNLFDRRNASRYGHVVLSPTFGRPLAMLPGRALSAWVTVGG